MLGVAEMLSGVTSYSAVAARVPTCRGKHPSPLPPSGLLPESILWGLRLILRVTTQTSAASMTACVKFLVSLALIQHENVVKIHIIQHTYIPQYNINSAAAQI